MGKFNKKTLHKEENDKKKKSVSLISVLFSEEMG